MDWIFYNLMGAFSLTFTGAFFRANPLGLPPWWTILLTIPVTAAFTQYSFLKAFLLGPSFFAVWFTGSAFCALAGLLCSTLVFHEQLNLLNVLGILFVIGGAWLVTR
jgi:drug/metabolite transporter (DMT)-like permease